MTVSPTGTCRSHSCSSRATKDGYCDRHQGDAGESKRNFDRFRADDPVRALYKGKLWQRTRLIVLRRDILCRSCGHQAATEADHILTARLVLDNFGLDEFYNPERIQGLCHRWHSRILHCVVVSQEGDSLTNPSGEVTKTRAAHNHQDMTSRSDKPWLALVDFEQLMRTKGIETTCLTHPIGSAFEQAVTTYHNGPIAMTTGKLMSKPRRIVSAAASQATTEKPGTSSANRYDMKNLSVVDAR